MLILTLTSLSSPRVDWQRRGGIDNNPSTLFESKGWNRVYDIVVGISVWTMVILILYYNVLNIIIKCVLFWNKTRGKRKTQPHSQALADPTVASSKDNPAKPHIPTSPEGVPTSQPTETPPTNSPISACLSSHYPQPLKYSRLSHTLCISKAIGCLTWGRR